MEACCSATIGGLLPISHPLLYVYYLLLCYHHILFCDLITPSRALHYLEYNNIIEMIFFLQVMTLNPVCESVETAQGVPLTVTGVAQVKKNFIFDSIENFQCAIIS